MADVLNNLKFPDGLDEGDLLSWVEGEPMLATKRVALAAWMARDAELGRALQAMRRDRDLLRRMGEEVAPAGLLDGVAAQIEPLMERQMLLGLASGTDIDDRPPVSVVRPPRSGVLATLFADRLGRRIAIAAAGLLLVGGSTYFIAQSMTNTGGPRPLPRLASAEREQAEPGDLMIALDPEIRGQAEQPDAIAMTAPADDARSFAAKAEASPETAASGLAFEEPSMTLAAAAEGAATPDSSALVEPLVEPLVLADAVEPEPEMGPFPSGPIDAVRAVELAREGRLVVKVTAQDAGLAANPTRVALRLRNARSAAWTVEGEAPAQIASAAIPAGDDFNRASRMPQPEPLIFAGHDEPTRFPGEPIAKFFGPPSPAAPTLAQEPRVYSVQLRLEPANLTRLKNALRNVGGEVTFEETAEPLPLLDEPALRPQAILWWGQSPAGWTRWARVPVVVDLPR